MVDYYQIWNKHTKRIYGVSKGYSELEIKSICELSNNEDYSKFVYSPISKRKYDKIIESNDGSVFEISKPLK